jgi:VanZ family protein
MKPLTNIRILGFRLGVVALTIYWLAIFLGTHLPEVPQVMAATSDKVKHAGAYFGLGLLLCYVSSGKNVYRRFLMIFVLITVYGALDEWSQQFVPGRYPDVLDWISDVLGVGTAIFFYAIMRAIFQRRVTSLSPVG